jgi:paraquat-inducible protein A
MGVYPDIGVIFFASVVIITMIASQKFDPRLIWDRPQNKKIGQ